MSQTPYQTPMNSGGPTGMVRMEAIGEAWRTQQKNMGTWAIAVLIFFAVSYGVNMVFSLVTNGIILGMASGKPSDAAAGAAFIVIFGMAFLTYILTQAVLSTLMGGLYKMAATDVQGGKSEVGQLFSQTNKFADLFIAQIIIGIGGMIGFCLCIIPGFIWMGLTMMTLPLIINRNMRAMEAIQASIEIMKPQMGMAALAWFVFAFVGGIGILACGIGVLFTMGLTYLATTVVFRDMVGFSEPLTGGSMFGAATSPAPTAPVAPVAPAPVAEPVAEMPAEEPAAPAEEPALEEAPTEEPKDEPQA